MAKHIDDFSLLFGISFWQTHPTGNVKTRQRHAYIESNRVQFNGTRVVPSGEALTSEAIKMRRGLLKRALTGKSGIRCGSIPSWSGLSDIPIVSRDIGAVTVLCREGVDRMGHVHVRISDWDIHGCLGLRAPVRGGRTES